MSVVFNESESRALRQFYEAELVQTVARYEHLKSVLAKLGVQVDSLPSGSNPLQIEAKQVTVASKPKRKRKGKRGRKSIWGDFILKSLRKIDRPVYYNELIQMAQIQFNIKEDKLKELKAAINQSAFRLRTVHGKIDTIGESGKKEKRVGLIGWFDEKGNLKAEYAAKVAQSA